jgi:glycosyltransferase involved in cell wall biosynthesis
VKTIIHVIPFESTGGVETAALSMRYFRGPAFDFQVRVLFPGELNGALRRKSFSPLAHIAAAHRLSVLAPDILIVSLWRAAIVGVFCKLFRPKTRLVVFLHCAKYVHFVDKWATRVAVSLAIEVWSDSRATLDATFPRYPRGRSRIISYLPRRFSSVTGATPQPVFVYWGRLARQKNLERAIKIFALVRERFREARFLVIGPDGGELDALREVVRSYCVHDEVLFLGRKAQAELAGFAREASFFLLTSDYEGMGLAVVEAMQMGLVPIVTKVGEVGVYCKNGFNSILIDYDEQAAEDIIAVIGSARIFERLRANAIDTWSDKLTYGESIAASCQRVVTCEAFDPI